MECMTARERLRQSIPLITALLISIAVIVLAVYFRGALQQLGRFGLIGVFLFNVIGNATVVIPAPIGLAAACAVASQYGVLATGIASGLGSALGEMTAYLAGAGGNAVIPHGRIYRLTKHYMRRYGVLVVFLLAAIPNPIFDVGGLIAGALKMPWYVFFGATSAGKVVRFMLTALACSGALPFLEQLFLRR